VLRAERLEVAYGGVIALQECSLEVGEGDCLAVLGANGAGKSTLLRTLARSVRQRSGHLWWDGTRIDRWAADRAARHGIALVPEGRRLFSGLSVRENLEVGAARLPGSEVEGRLAEVLRWFPELAQRLDLPAGRLSGGEQQMAGIGRALMGRPRLLLVDELSLGLAPLVTRRIYEILAGIATGGIAIVLVEQYTDLALAAAGRALVLEKGRVAFTGTADELRRRPELLETAYLGRELLARAPEAARSGAAPAAGGGRSGIRGAAVAGGGRGAAPPRGAGEAAHRGAGPRRGRGRRRVDPADDPGVGRRPGAGAGAMGEMRWAAED
jgi:branched-chain amino acid transport system ATP-binding protein